jgi:hypothetical protein
MVEKANQPRRKVWATANVPSDEPIFLDDISVIAVREGVDVVLRDAWGSGEEVGTVTLEAAMERLSPEALDRRISEQRTVRDRASAEIRRLVETKTSIYREPRSGDIEIHDM